MNRFRTDYPQLESILDGDISDACLDCYDKYALDVDVVDMHIDLVDYEDDTTTIYQVIVDLYCEGLEFSIKFECVDDEMSDIYEIPEITMYDIHNAFRYRYYMSMNQKYDAKDFKDRLAKNGLDVVY